MARLIDRKPARSEATLQADVRQLLLGGGLNLDENDLTVNLETQVGDGRRIDVEVGFTAIETKKDLRSPAILRDAEEQLGGYVRTRSEQVGQRYVGILTDGVDWRAYNLVRDQFALVSRFEAKQRTQPADLLIWLEGVLATAENIRPTPVTIAQRLGAESVSHQLDYTTLAALYEANEDLPTVKLKRELWAQLLRSALGAQFEDSDALFIEHTLLVNTAEIIAHLVLGIPDVKNTSPATLVLGQLFERANVFGVVESDFFDWVIEVPDGESFVRTVARRLSRFDWAHVEHDVLKILYESVIAPETRKKQGEYYTPDWLAEAMVTDVITDPLNQTVLDPSCGSGTFLFHAARRYLQAAEADGRPLRQVLDDLTEHVAGTDLHPVAVALARVTYLLAIGQERLAGQRGPIRVPVFLGDSVQWQQRTDLFDQGYLVIRTDTGARLFHNELRFSEDLLHDAGRFDQLINELADKAANRPASSTPSLTSTFHRLGIPREYHDEIKVNFELLCRLVDEGRNHIWSYYVRNLARPMWLSRTENRVNVLIGNPPWLSYRHMPQEMQQLFKEMSQNRHLWRGDEVATHQDLSGLFIARAVQQYLADGGTFAFVVPNPVLDRPYWQGFRAGNYPDPHEPTRVEFTGSWDLRRLRPHFFPRGSAVIFGRRMKIGVGEVAGNAVPLPKTTNRWTGKIPAAATDWAHVRQWITRQEAELRYVHEDLISSPYSPRFFQGATIVPRVLFFVRPQQAGPLGLGAGRVLVRSERTNTEKVPWKDLPDQEGVIERQFLRPVLLGESVLPY
ncbi:MAG: N-6 DNA methylase, partial [Sciscionella sp.]